MNKNFPRLICLLRKEKGLSQKQAANELQISQALLSHYEKGIRECGLDFLMRAADFYGVSCDYLLGRTLERNGAVITADNIPSDDDKPDEVKLAIIPTLSKKLILNSLNIIFDLATKTKNPTLINNIAQYMNIACYKMFRHLYTYNLKNPQDLFSIDLAMFQSLSTSEMIRLETYIKCQLNGVENKTTQMDVIYCEQLEDVIMNQKYIEENYPSFASSLLNIIQNAEKKILK